jgi:hypothetical protein
LVQPMEEGEGAARVSERPRVEPPTGVVFEITILRTLVDDVVATVHIKRFAGDKARRIVR